MVAENVFYLSMAFCLGYGVLKYKVKTGYSRKVYHFVLIFMYQANAYWFDVTSDFQISYMFLTMGLQFVLYTLPTIRNPRCWCCRVMFAQFDRPEDRPNTMHWIFFQFWSATLIYVIGFNIVKEIGDYDLLAACGWISTISHGLGDGLAEPVGIRYGKHPYKVTACCASKDQQYTRSLEGSATVFAFTFASVFTMIGSVSLAQFLTLLFVMPVAQTLIEAKSPHTMDAPFLMFGGLFGSYLLCELVAML